MHTVRYKKFSRSEINDYVEDIQKIKVSLHAYSQSKVAFIVLRNLTLQ